MLGDKEKSSRSSTMCVVNSFLLPTLYFLCSADPVYERSIVRFGPAYLRFLVTRIVFIVCGLFLLGGNGWWDTDQVWKQTVF